MRWKEIVAEAPIGDIAFHGGTEPASFRAPDIGIVTNDKWQTKVRRVLEKAPVVINLVFVNHDQKYQSDLGIGDPERKLGDQRGSGEMSPDVFRKVFGFDVKADPKAATIVFGFNEGNERLPLTPWILAHRIGHAIEEKSGRGGPFAPVLAAFNQIIIDLHWDDASSTVNPDDLAHAVGSFKSARDGSLTSTGEFVLECFAQYLTSGEIRLRALTNTIIATMSYDAKSRYPKLIDMHHGKEIAFKDNDVVAQINQSLESWRVQAEKVFQREMNNAVGKIIVL